MLKALGMPLKRAQKSVETHNDTSTMNYWLGETRALSSVSFSRTGHETKGHKSSGLLDAALAGFAIYSCLACSFCTLVLRLAEKHNPSLGRRRIFFAVGAASPDTWVGWGRRCSSNAVMAVFKLSCAQSLSAMADYWVNKHEKLCHWQTRSNMSFVSI